MIPGEMKIADGEIELNPKRKTVTLEVTNTGDRPIQVGSHYHFFETNEALKFERKQARGFRLNIAAGTATNQIGRQRRRIQNRITMNAKPPNNWFIAPNSGHRMNPPWPAVSTFHASPGRGAAASKAATPTPNKVAP